MTPGTRLLDVGCGGGFALLLAARRDAVVSGLDATPALVEIARERVPGAAPAVGDLDDPLPYDAGRLRRRDRLQLGAVRRRPGGRPQEHATASPGPDGLISLVVWGPPDQCESGVLFAELGPLLPPARRQAPGAVAWSEEGQLEQLAELAGLELVTVAGRGQPARSTPTSPPLSARSSAPGRPGAPSSTLACRPSGVR